jgi:hypothetical protein
MTRTQLLSRFALAAGLTSGCGIRANQQAFDDFAEEESDLRCEIAMLCDDDAFCQAPKTHDFDRCDNFQDEEAAMCLDELQGIIDELEMLEPADREGRCSMLTTFSECNPLRDADPQGAVCADSVAGRPIRDADGRFCLARASLVQPHGEAMHPWSLDDAARAAAARRWLRDASYEHASIAAFARLSLDLLAHAPPPELIAAARAAALDEVRHTELCIEIARSLSGCDVTIGELPLDDVEPASLERMAIDALVDGAIGETTAALVARTGASSAEAPARSALETIAEDELRHAELAWATIGWALRRDPSLSRVLLETLARRRRPRPSSNDAAEPAAGIVSGRTAAVIESRVVQEIVGPLLDELCATVNGSAMPTAAHTS